MRGLTPDERRNALDRDANYFGPTSAAWDNVDNGRLVYLGADLVRTVLTLESGEMIRVWAWRDKRNGRFIPHIVKGARKP